MDESESLSHSKWECKYHKGASNNPRFSVNLATKRCARLNRLRFFREAATLQSHRGRFSLRIARFLGNSTHFGRHKASIAALFRSVSRFRL